MSQFLNLLLKYEHIKIYTEKWARNELMITLAEKYLIHGGVQLQTFCTEQKQPTLLFSNGNMGGGGYFESKGKEKAKS